MSLTLKIKYSQPCKKCGVLPKPLPRRWERSDYTCNACDRIRWIKNGYEGGKPSKHWARDYLRRPEQKEKSRTRYKTQAALKRGIIKKESCFCGNAKSQAHHEDYSKPLEIVWLCSKHHSERHRVLKSLSKEKSNGK